VRLRKSQERNGAVLAIVTFSLETVFAVSGAQISP
jgi:hypothetical protein